LVFECGGKRESHKIGRKSVGFVFWVPFWGEDKVGKKRGYRGKRQMVGLWGCVNELAITAELFFDFFPPLPFWGLKPEGT